MNRAQARSISAEQPALSQEQKVSFAVKRAPLPTYPSSQPRIFQHLHAFSIKIHRMVVDMRGSSYSLGGSASRIQPRPVVEKRSLASAATFALPALLQDPCKVSVSRPAAGSCPRLSPVAGASSLTVGLCCCRRRCSQAGTTKSAACHAICGGSAQGRGGGPFLWHRPRAGAARLPVQSWRWLPGGQSAFLVGQRGRVSL